MDLVTAGMLGAALFFASLGAWDRVTGQEPLHKWLALVAIPGVIAAALMAAPLLLAAAGALQPPAYAAELVFHSEPYDAGSVSATSGGGAEARADVRGYRLTGASGVLRPLPRNSTSPLRAPIGLGDAAALAWPALLLPSYSAGYLLAGLPQSLRRVGGGRRARRPSAAPAGVARAAAPARYAVRLTPDFRLELVREP